MHPRHPSPLIADPDLGELAAGLAIREHRAAVVVVEMILSSDPSRRTCRPGVKIALAAGVSPPIFDDPASCLIFEACAFTRDRELAFTLRAARHLLRHFGFWDPAAPAFSRGPKWSDESLVSAADSWPGCALLPIRAAELVELRRRRDRAEAWFGLARDALAGRPLPLAGPVVIVNAEPRRRR